MANTKYCDKCGTTSTFHNQEIEDIQFYYCDSCWEFLKKLLLQWRNEAQVVFGKKLAGIK